MLYSEKVKERVQKLNIIDDVFFQKMAEDKDFCEEVISTILEQRVKVLRATPQKSLKNLSGRSVILDALCELADERICNVEVQKADDDDHQRRVRYNASAITSNSTATSTKFEDVPDIVMIFISKFDIFEQSRTMYHVDRVVRETGKIVENGLEEIYVNTKIDDDSPVARLMRIFTETDKYDHTEFPATSKRKRYLKVEETGVNEMCDIIQTLIDEENEKAREEERKKVRIEEQQKRFIYAIKLVNKGSITIECAIECEPDKDDFKEWLAANKIKY